MKEVKKGRGRPGGKSETGASQQEIVLIPQPRDATEGQEHEVGDQRNPTKNDQRITKFLN